MFGRKWEIRRAVRPVVVGTVMHLAVSYTHLAMLFDEPTSALDPEMINEVLDVMVLSLIHI